MFAKVQFMIETLAGQGQKIVSFKLRFINPRSFYILLVSPLLIFYEINSLEVVKLVNLPSIIGVPSKFTKVELKNSIFKDQVSYTKGVKRKLI